MIYNISVDFSFCPFSVFFAFHHARFRSLKNRPTELISVLNYLWIYRPRSFVINSDIYHGQFLILNAGVDFQRGFYVKNYYGLRKLYQHSNNRYGLQPSVYALSRNGADRRNSFH